MLLRMNFESLVEIIMLKIIFSVVGSDVGVVTSPGKLIRFPRTVSRV